MALTAHKATEAEVLQEALLNAASNLGLTLTEVGEIIGRNRTSLHRNNLSPDSKPGELALLLIRIYRSLYALIGGDPMNMRHWMRTPNHHTGGIPAEQIKSITGLATVSSYLDAMRGKV